MSSPYIDGDTLDRCKDLLLHGQPLEQLAGKLRCSPEHLAGLLGDKSPKTKQPAAGEALDLWSGEDQL